MQKKQYSRNDSVAYALKYGLTPNSNYRYFGIFGEAGGDCTNFVSQCLNAGGAPMDFTKRLPWWYIRPELTNMTSHTWTLSWTLAGSLFWFLKERYQKNLPGLKGYEVSDIGALEIGDLIFYRNMKGVINHSAIITDFRDGMPFITQHTFEAINISHIKPNKSKMHFIKIDF